MMSGHGANPIFFNKKMKIGCPEHSVTPLHPLRPITSYFRLTSPPHLKVDVKCVSPLTSWKISDLTQKPSAQIPEAFH